ncbi:MAG: 16S rRNA (uracil(1498)-N(3))-methyltransferase [Negativicutes bacterium]|nr:16S rRNA (uracil(1498)-N(3))-methyltransferase [Negativicutes bacterium]
MRQLLVEGNWAANHTVNITGGDFHHLVVVLRRRPGDTVSLTNGRGRTGRAKIAKISRREAALVIEAVRDADAGDRSKIVLCQAVLPADRFNFVVTKAVEMAVDEIWPVVCERCTTRAVSLLRALKAAKTAVEQSGNPFLPVIAPAQPLEAVYSAIPDHDFVVVMHEHIVSSRNDWRKVNPARRNIWLFVGPEGGFTGKELSVLMQGRVAVCSGYLGPTVLRSETAAVAATAVVSHLLGRYG